MYHITTKYIYVPIIHNKQCAGSALLVGGFTYYFSEYKENEERGRLFPNSIISQFVSKYGENYLDDENLKVRGFEKGIPDEGNGPISTQFLDHRHWHQFASFSNVRQTNAAHAVVIIPLILASGVIFPRVAALTGIIHLINQYFYTLNALHNGTDNEMNRRYEAVNSGIFLLLGSILIFIPICRISIPKIKKWVWIRKLNWKLFRRFEPFIKE